MIERTKRESSEQYIDLRERLKAACDSNEEPDSSSVGAPGDEIDPTKLKSKALGKG